MSYTIHLEDENTQQLISSMRLMADRMYDRVCDVSRHVTFAEWQGPAREEFVEELYVHTRKLCELCDQVDLLAFQVALKTDQWSEIAARFIHRTFPLY